MNSPIARTLLIFAAFILGYFFPELSAFESAVRWLIIVMLFITFINVSTEHLHLRREHIYLTLANIVGALLVWVILFFCGQKDLALIGFFIAITPTATAAPVITGFLKGNVAFALTGVISSSLFLGIAIPLLIPWILPPSAEKLHTQQLILDMAISVGTVLLMPFLLAQLTRYFYPKAKMIARKLKNTQFFIWGLVLLLISASGSQFIRQHKSFGIEIYLSIAFLALIICVASFSIGKLIGTFLGSKNYGRECSQCLGQKNTSLTIYLALTYANPITALGITFYMVFHNTWSAIQIQKLARQDRLDQTMLNEELQVLDNNLLD